MFTLLSPAKLFSIWSNAPVKTPFPLFEAALELLQSEAF